MTAPGGCCDRRAEICTHDHRYCVRNGQWVYRRRNESHDQGRRDRGALHHRRRQDTDDQAEERVRRHLEDVVQQVAAEEAEAVAEALDPEQEDEQEEEHSRDIANAIDGSYVVLVEFSHCDIIHHIELERE